MVKKFLFVQALIHTIERCGIHTIERCGKLNERIRSGKKVYAGDLGMRNMITGFRDKGAIFENLIYFEIRNYSPCYFLQNGIEIDFKTDDFLIEAKYKSEMTYKQKKMLINYKK